MTTQGKQDSTAIQQRIKKFEIFAENQGKINPSFNANEGKVNAKGMVAPPVPPRSPETKLSSQSELQKATAPKVAPPVPFKSHEAKKIGAKILAEQQRKSPVPFASAQSTPNSDSTERFKFTVNQPGFIHTTARKNHVGNGLNELNTKKNADSATSTPNVADKKKVTFADPEKYVIPDNTSEKIGLQSVKIDMKEAHELNPFKMLMGTMPSHTKEQRSESTTSSLSTSSIDSQSTTSSQQADLDRMMMENINAFEQNPNVQSKSNPATIDDMLFGGVNDPTPCLEPQKSEAPSKETSVKKVEEFSIGSPAQDNKKGIVEQNVHYEDLKGSVKSEVEQRRALNFDEEVRVQDISLIGKPGACAKAKERTATKKQLKNWPLPGNGMITSTPVKKAEESSIGSPTKNKKRNISGDSGVFSCSDISYDPLDHNPIYQGRRRFSSDRLNVHPLLRNDMGGDVSPGAKRNVHLEKCTITHDGSKIEPKMERKHNFAGPEASPKHAKADIAICPTTRGNGKKGISHPNISEDKPLTEGFSNVNVKELMSKFSGK